MKKGIAPFVAAALSVLVFAAIGVLSAADLPEETLIDNEGYKSKRMGSVNFTHQGHAEDYELNCNECHHVYKDDENVWKTGDPVQKCSACHKPQNKVGEAMRLPNAYHQKCKGCHKEVKDEKDKCSDCHEQKP
jgi:hypothetical protein